MQHVLGPKKTMGGGNKGNKEISKMVSPIKTTEPAKKIPNYLKFVFGGAAG